MVAHAEFKLHYPQLSEAHFLYDTLPINTFYDVFKQAHRIDMISTHEALTDLFSCLDV